ncbi:MAG TPA: menaquinone biosynthesis protein [Vicinamibacterales bacterium]|nr:menaquinone biosynthesis protein [Vicinamibacterales bacterium]
MKPFDSQPGKARPLAQGGPLRLGAVSYLNTKPLVYGLDAHPEEFDVRFDVPSKCANLLHAGEIDLGLIPAIEYLRGEYYIVPGVSIASDGPVATVAVFTRKPIAQVKTLALDLSSRTSVALTRVLCAKHWKIDPSFTPAEPDLDAMLGRADAALMIGDPAFAIDPAKRGVTKIDLGAEWKALTGLPFVYAMWVGRAGAASAAQCRALQRARDNGLAHLAEIARDVSGGDAGLERRSLEYLRDNLKYGLGPGEAAGLRRFHELAAEIDLVAALQPLRYYEQ